MNCSTVSKWALVATMAAGLSVLGTGCGTTSTETAERDTMTANVGNYPPPPSGIVKARVGVPQMKIENSGGHEKALESLAADQMNTLLFQTERFDVVERTQLDKVLGEQNMEGIVRPDQMAKAGQVMGAQLLLVGKVTNLRLKTEKTNKGFGIGDIRLPGGGSLGGFDYKKKENKITAECGVDIRLVESTSGKTVAAHFGEFKRIDTLSAFGVDVLGASASADADLEISDDDKGKILRLALDEALRKMLPKIDSYLLSQGKAAPAGSSSPAAAKHFCSSCGKEVAGGVKFCPNCGAKAE